MLNLCTRLSMLAVLIFMTVPPILAQDETPVPQVKQSGAPQACTGKPTWNIQGIPDGDELYQKLARQLDIPWPTCDPTIILPGCWKWNPGVGGWAYGPTCLVCSMGNCKNSPPCPVGTFPFTMIPPQRPKATKYEETPHPKTTQDLP